MLLYIIAATVIAILNDANARIKGAQQTEDHKVKISKFSDHITIFLRDINCLTRI